MDGREMRVLWKWVEKIKDKWGGNLEAELVQISANPDFSKMPSW